MDPIITLYLVARADTLVRDPLTGEPLPTIGSDPVDIGDGELQYGAAKPYELYWRRRIADGDAIEVDRTTGRPLVQLPAESNGETARRGKAKE